MSDAVIQSKVVRYQASSANAKYLGSNLQAYLHNLRAETIEPILEKYNIKALAQEEWMDAQLQLDFLREMEEQFTFTELVAVGMKSAEFVPLPPKFISLEKLVESLVMIYHTTVKDPGPEEGVTIEKLGERSYRLTNNIPVPPFVVYGYLYGLLRRVRRRNEYPAILIVEDGTPYIFEINWEILEPSK